MPDFIKFVEVEVKDGRKTKIWAVLTADGNKLLGQIEWYAPWRRYVFYAPRSEGREFLFDAGCLQRISERLQFETEQRGIDRKLEKSLGYFGRKKTA